VITYIITGQVENALGAASQRAPHVLDAVRMARQMLAVGMVNVSINDGLGYKISGDDLIACCEGKKQLTNDLRAVRF
jgi:hypothetical protein